MSTLKVSLADAPTDVLVELVDHGPATVAELTHLAPDDTVSPAATVSYAVDLLRRIGYVRAFGDHYRWAATDAGAQAVRAARVAAATQTPSALRIDAAAGGDGAPVGCLPPDPRPAAPQQTQQRTQR